MLAGAVVIGRVDLSPNGNTSSAYCCRILNFVKSSSLPGSCDGFSTLGTVVLRVSCDWRSCLHPIVVMTVRHARVFLSDVA